MSDIQKLYKHIGFFDQFGDTFLLFLFLLFIFILIVLYCIFIIQKTIIKENWADERCQPYVLPFAGFIHRDDDNQSWHDSTVSNFTYCTQTILKNSVGTHLQPFAFVINMFSTILTSIQSSMNANRAMFDKVRTSFETFSKEVMGRTMNTTIELQKIILSMRDFIGKVQGTMTAGLFTSLGTYFTLKTLLGSIAQFIITILIALAALIAILWAIPFTWGVAATNTAIFTAISVPMVLILAFLTEVLKVHPTLSLPSLPKPKLKCFDPYCLFQTSKGMKYAFELNVGDSFNENEWITSTLVLSSKDEMMYQYHDFIISGSHYVFDSSSFIPISKHKDSIQINDYKEPFLYCFTTNTKRIHQFEDVFLDWDDVISLENPFRIHSHYHSGFNENTNIELKTNEIKKIKDICVNDILKNGEIVYGIVKVDGKKIKTQMSYWINNQEIKGSNLLFQNENLFIERKENNNKDDLLYHLLTSTSTFTIHGITIYDYNKMIDID
jgi:hypothetical protein